jgi:hydrogenase-4 component B
MTALFLPAMAALVSALLALAVAGALAAGDQRAHLATMGSLVVCGLGMIVAAGFLLAGGQVATLTVGVGLPGMPLHLALDGLSGAFLLLLMLAGTAASAAALDDHGAYRATAPFLPAFIGGMALTLLAGDGFALLLGFELMSIASFALVLTDHRNPEVRAAALLYIGVATLGAVCLVAALGLLSAGGDLRFTTIRAHPPEGWRATVIMGLVLIGAGSKAGLVPLHVWLPPAHAAAPAHVSALMSGAMTKIALYVLIRLVFDLCGPGQPIAWGVPLVLVGAAGAVLGGLRANMEGDIKTVLASSTIEHIGLITVGLGVALAARSADLTGLAALAFGAALLHAMAHMLFKSLLFLAAGATQHAAGTRRLDRLGGLIARMPKTTVLVLIGAAGLAALPPSGGFAGEWGLLQAVIAAARIGGLGWQVLMCVAAAMMALAAALAASAVVRLIGVAWLGRPRSPRAAGATDPGPAMIRALAGLAGLSVAVGLFPGAVLELLAPTIGLVTGAGAQNSMLTMAVQSDQPGYIAPAIGLLLAVAGGLVFFVVRRWTVAGERRAPAWDCGFGAPPPWLPFGDPATQYGGASFAQPLRRALGASLMAAHETVDMPDPGDVRPASLTVTLADPSAAYLFAPFGRLRDRLAEYADRMQLLTIRSTLAVMFVALLVFLAAVAGLQQL